jgi:hypothetical protein
MFANVFDNLVFISGLDYVTDDISSPDYTYFGWCKPGTDKAATGWMILRVTNAKPETFRWADGVALHFNPNHSWNGRAGYTYAA